MIFFKRLLGFILTALFIIAFSFELIFYTLRWLFTGRDVPTQPTSTKTYQRLFDKFVNL